MSKKINPNIFRSELLTESYSNWVDIKTYNEKLENDFLIRKFLKEFFNKFNLNIGYIKIIRNEININKYSIIKVYINIFFLNTINIQILTKEQILYLKKNIENIVKNLNKTSNIVLTLTKKSNKLFVICFLYEIIEKIKKRINYKLILNSILDKLKEYSIIKGVKIQISGRINGQEKASILKHNFGSLKLQTIFSKIDFFQKSVITKDGLIGIKMWICF